MNKELLRKNVKKALFWLVYIALMFVNVFDVWNLCDFLYFVVTDFGDWAFSVGETGLSCRVGFIYRLVLMIVDVEVIIIGNWCVYKKKKYALWIMAIPFIMMVFLYMAFQFRLFDCQI